MSYDSLNKMGAIQALLQVVAGAGMMIGTAQSRKRSKELENITRRTEEEQAEWEGKNKDKARAAFKKKPRGYTTEELPPAREWSSPVSHESSFARDAAVRAGNKERRQRNRWGD